MMTEQETIEKCAAWIEGYSQGQIRMACGEMTAQEMRTVLAVQRWWIAALRHIGTQGFEAFESAAPKR